MYKGKNPSALRSQESIANSFLELVKVSTYDKISITDIMDSTGLARQTFYKVFDSKDDIFEFIFRKLFSEYFLLYLAGIKKPDIDSICATAKLFFRFSYTYKEFMALLISNNRISLLRKVFNECLINNPLVDFAHDGIRNASEKENTASFIITGMIGMLISWAEDDFKTNPDELSELVCRITDSVYPDTV